MILKETSEYLHELYGKRLKEISIEKVVVGIFFTGVKLSNSCGGISYTPLSDIKDTVCCPSMAAKKPAPGSLKGVSVHEIMNAEKDTPLFNAIKIAVMNALSSEEFLADSGYEIIYDKDLHEIIDLNSIKRISIVGAFIPFIKRLKSMEGIELYVVEKKKSSLKDDELRYYVPAERASEVVPISDTVIITGSSIANGTIDELLSYFKTGSTVAVVGPTASFLPDAFFKRNVGIVSGVIVTDSNAMLDILSDRGSAYHLFNTCAKKINIVNSSGLSKF
ncbi:MAG: DUF364 domain-containing protein [Deltaproteobacteria bacterium]